MWILRNINQQRRRGSTLMAYFVIMVVLSSFIAATAAYVAQTSRLAERRNKMISAIQFAEGGAVLAVNDLNTAVTNRGTGTLFAKLASMSFAPYTMSTNSTGGYRVFTRTINAGSPFSNQTVNAQIWITNAPQPLTAQVVTTATVGGVTQTATVNATITFGFGAAILSVNDGTSDTGASKSVAQDGNVTINGSAPGGGGAKGGPGGGGSSSSYALVVYGGTNGLAAMANGRVNVSSTSAVNIPANSISMTNYSAGTPIPDYTSQGTSNTLFDISRFIAVANATPGGFAPSGNNHFSNLSNFIAAANLHTAVNPMEGVIVVDVYGGSDSHGTGADPNMKSMDTTHLPNGINVRGSLVFNFTGLGWDPTTSKIIVDTPVNVNAADLSGLVATNPATYTTGYPPVYTDSTKNPVNINIAPTYQNFTSSDDLPALLYTIGVVDLHNSLNICGAMYTPSYMEIENKHSGDTQYINGELIMGNGIYLENTSQATTVIAYDHNAVNNLATAGTAGKKVFVTYWQQQ